MLENNLEISKDKEWKNDYQLGNGQQFLKFFVLKDTLIIFIYDGKEKRVAILFNEHEKHRTRKETLDYTVESQNEFQLIFN